LGNATKYSVSDWGEFRGKFGRNEGTKPNNARSLCKFLIGGRKVTLKRGNQRRGKEEKETAGHLLIRPLFNHVRIAMSWRRAELSIGKREGDT